MAFRLANVSGAAALVDDQGNWFELAGLTDGAIGPDPMSAVANVDGLHAAAARLADARPNGEFEQARLDGRVGPPIPRPVNCFAVGLNYREHAAESNVEPPANPLVFTKFPTCLVGPDDDVELASDTADWEVELVVVIGRGGRAIAASQAWDHVAGVTVGQDISDRTLQFSASPPHFDLGKSRDTYGPLGPVVVSPDLLADPDDLALRCAGNGVSRQDDRTANLIFDVPFLVAYLSSILTLQPGDLLFTGTPPGVGMATGKFLAAGDLITSEVEGIGELRNRCR
jgi:2,4-didehydro-3-deoxy-L-rhamnonate hydrolase